MTIQKHHFTDAAEANRAITSATAKLIVKGYGVTTTPEGNGNKYDVLEYGGTTALKLGTLEQSDDGKGNTLISFSPHDRATHADRTKINGCIEEAVMECRTGGRSAVIGA